MKSNTLSLYKDLYRRVAFLMMGLVIYRLGAHITVPGVDVSLLKSSFDSGDSGLLGLFNVFSGGALSRLSLFSLGLMPYISSSIVMQLLTYAIPYLYELNQEGYLGRKKISQYTRYAAICLSLFQSVGIVKLALMQGLVKVDPWLFTFTTMVTLSAGTMLSLWLGEQMTERGIGNGISLLIFAGIASKIPESCYDFLMQLREGSISLVIGLATLGFIAGLVYFVVFFERSTRQIPIQHARQQMHAPLNNVKPSVLPLKLNLAGVLPPIFATSLVLLPNSILSILGNDFINSYPFVQQIVMLLYPGKPLYYIVYAILIFFFSFFYTTLTFNPKEISDSLKRSGGVVPGIRPGMQTENYISGVVDRLTGVGAVYLCIITLFPDLVRVFWHLPFSFGGTTMLIAVVVMIDMITQIQAHLVPVKYRQLLKGVNSASLLKS